MYHMMTISLQSIIFMYFTTVNIINQTREQIPYHFNTSKDN